jgi:hypothetical protein
MDETWHVFLNGFAHHAFYWEIVESLYKILMCGLLLFAPGGRGSTSQLFSGLCASMAMACLHLRNWPYQYHADNWLRLAAELQIFQTLAVALVLKGRGSAHTADEISMSTNASELSDAYYYDWLLVGSFWLLSPFGVLCTVVAKAQMARRTRNERNGLLLDVFNQQGSLR